MRSLLGTVDNNSSIISLICTSISYLCSFSGNSTNCDISSNFLPKVIVFASVYNSSIAFFMLLSSCLFSGTLIMDSPVSVKVISADSSGSTYSSPDNIASFIIDNEPMFLIEAGFSLIIIF